ncbi:MAG: hypothetical protein HY817_02145 [Candidatus Abawacabacteria bacterium]|nr:hypothetical protein [Candidatus Abawacabacteria bacterium]
MTKLAVVSPKPRTTPEVSPGKIRAKVRAVVERSARAPRYASLMDAIGYVNVRDITDLQQARAKLEVELQLAELREQQNAAIPVKQREHVVLIRTSSKVLRACIEYVDQLLGSLQARAAANDCLKTE